MAELRQRIYKHQNILAIFLLLTIILGFSYQWIDFSNVPKEDAAMLMRYAEHFGNGYGIVWNIGEKPVDGATDFLVVIIDGILFRAGLSIESATRLIGFVSHLITVILVFLTTKSSHIEIKLMAFFSAVYVAIGPGLYYVSAYFTTPFFALFACFTWYLGLKIIERPDNPVDSILFSGSALITGLIRPEGVILSCLMLLALLITNGFTKSKNLLTIFITTFILIGGSYFLWRWIYFGYPLPNPYYKKGGGSLHLDGLQASLFLTLLYSIPSLPIIITGWLSKKSFKMALGVTLALFGFAAAFLLISNEMNFQGRFQYITLPLSIMSALFLINRLEVFPRLKKWRKISSRTLTFGLVCFYWIFLVAYPVFINSLWGTTYSKNGLYDIGHMLFAYHEKGYTIATSEAGLLPLISEWNAVDTWGLNDTWIAHHKSITADYLDQKKPEIIMFHSLSSPTMAANEQNAWNQMTHILQKYAEDNDYILAASFGDVASDTHVYYVRKNFPDSSEIVARIRNCKYYWNITGTDAKNFALEAQEP